MGNIGSSGGDRRRRRRRNNNTLPTANPPPPPSLPPPPPPSSENPANRIVFAAAIPYPNPNPNQLYQYAPGYYQHPPGTIPVPYDDHHHHHHHSPYPPPPPPPPYQHHPHPWTTGGRYTYGGPMMPQTPPPYVEHQKAVTIRNDVNLKKESLKLEPDPDNPGRFLVSFTFDATVSGRITLIFFAKESESCNLTATKEDILPPITMDFEKGLGQKFKQASGSGIDFSVFEDVELFKAADTDIYPLAVKAEAAAPSGGDTEGQAESLGSKNAQITQAVYEKDKGEIKIKVVKQILWVNGMRYELQEIYGIGNTVEGDDDSSDDANDPGKECVICLSEPRDTTVLPCRHMCMCSGCAKVLRFQTNRCPICRQPVERLLEIKVHGNNGTGNNNGQAGTAEQD